MISKFILISLSMLSFICANEQTEKIIQDLTNAGIFFIIPFIDPKTNIKSDNSLDIISKNFLFF